ncbi:MAG: leucine-rich repeat protein [Clostridia bacterium]|nr:leucine-rich repeat protein [Clostridia bacterium]
MKQVKRVASCLLAALLLLAAVPFGGIVAFAEEVPAVLLGQPMELPMEDTSTVYVSFTPDKTQGYHIYSEGRRDPRCAVYDQHGKELTWSDDANGLNFEIYVTLNAGETYELEIYVYDPDGDSPVTLWVTESDIASIDIEDITLIKDAATEWNYEEVDGEEVGWTAQRYDYFLSYTITRKDGSTFNQEESDLEIAVTDDQSYTNEWKVGHTYTAVGEIAGVQDTFSVTLVESPIVSASFENAVIIKESCGEWRTDEVWDEDLGEYKTVEYYRYNTYDAIPDEITLHLQGGTTVTICEREDFRFTWNGVDYYADWWSDQGAESPWTVGKNPVYISIAGYDIDYAVEIIESPVVSVSVDPVILYKNVDGYWTQEEIWDEEIQQNVPSPEYFYYHCNPYHMAVTMNDGTVLHMGYGYETEHDWNGIWLDLAFWTDQNYENRWLEGKNTAYGSVGGYEFSYTVDVVELLSYGQFEYVVVDDGAIITDLLGISSVLEIPATIGDYPVVGVSYLGDWWQMEELILPDSVVTVDEDLFWGLWNLRAVRFGAAVEELTPEMFADLYLEELTVSADNPYYCVKDNVLYDKAMTKVIALAAGAMESYEVPATVSDISALFLPAYGDVAVTFAAGNTNFVTESGVTYNKDKTQIILVSKNLSGTYVMPGTVQLIAPNAFRGCDQLTQVTVSANVTEIAYGAFAQCTSLNVVALPEGLVEIGEEAFLETEALTSITLPNTLEWVGYRAFRESGLTALSVPDSMMYIDSQAFAYTPIATLDLGEGVDHISSLAFAYTEISSVVLPDSVTVVSYGAFEGCSNLASVTFSKNMYEISNWTFYGTALTKLHLPAHIEYVGEYAFADTLISEVTFGNPAIWLSEGAFSGCPLKELQLTNQMKEIPRYAFSDTDLTSLTVPYGVTGIMYGAFMGSEDLAAIDLPTSVIEMGGHTFDGTAWYEAQPEGLVYLDHVLYGYKGDIPENATLIVKDGIKVIADFALENDPETPNTLKELYLPPSVEYIGWWLFGYRDDTVISGVAGSYAQEYAEENGYTFVARTLNGWIKSGSQWTYYNQGVCVTNKWMADSLGWCYLGADGYCVTNAWVKDSLGWCYLDQNGRMVYGKWVQDGGKWYYLDGNGYMVSNKWMKDSKGWVYLDGSGAMKTNGWVMDSVGWCYVGADGYAVTNCWKRDSVGWCYLNANGSMTKSAWVKDGGKWYYLDQNGYMVSNKWMKDSKGWVYLDGSGAMKINGWVMDSVGWCYVGGDGYAVTNCWKKDSVGWCYLNANGSMTKSAWVQDGGKRYYLDGNGYMVANKTVTIGGKKYTFNASGVLVS